MTWRDATVEAPPDDERVLITYGDRIEFGSYNATQSSRKGCALPNAEARAIWCISSVEGSARIRYWAPIPEPPKEEP